MMIVFATSKITADGSSALCLISPALNLINKCCAYELTFYNCNKVEDSKYVIRFSLALKQITKREHVLSASGRRWLPFSTLVEAIVYFCLLYFSGTNSNRQKR
jgi:hypothetical protein